MALKFIECFVGSQTTWLGQRFVLSLARDFTEAVSSQTRLTSLQISFGLFDFSKHRSFSSSMSRTLRLLFSTFGAPQAGYCRREQLLNLISWRFLESLLPQRRLMTLSENENLESTLEGPFRAVQVCVDSAGLVLRVPSRQRPFLVPPVADRLSQYRSETFVCCFLVQTHAIEEATICSMAIQSDGRRPIESTSLANGSKVATESLRSKAGCFSS